MGHPCTTIPRVIVCHKTPLGTPAGLGLSCRWDDDRSPTRSGLLDHQALPATMSLRLLLSDRPTGWLIHTPLCNHHVVRAIFLMSSVMDHGAGLLHRVSTLGTRSLVRR
jgi:hypothetical protein